MNEKAKFIKTNEMQNKRIEEIRVAFSNLYEKIEKLCKSSRETSLSMTKLEEAQFWAIKGISREEDK